MIRLNSNDLPIKLVKLKSVNQECGEAQTRSFQDFLPPFGVREWSSTELSFSASSSCSVSLNFSVVNITGIVSM